MAEILKADVVDALLRHKNWTLATAVAEKVIPDWIFQPKPAPRPALVVPVDVQALYVPPSHDERYIKFPMSIGPGAQGAPVPPFSTPVARGQGVHLHWALPDGLLRGEMQDDEDRPITMQPLPNRWLVCRMTGRNKQRMMSVRSWIIEADSGRSFDLGTYPDGGIDGGATPVEATALDGLVGGSPNWTASYDAALNRFAFHDPLDDVTPSQLTVRFATYCVIGWWSERTHDPLAGHYSSFAVSRTLQNFGWTASSAPIVYNWDFVKAASTGGGGVSSGDQSETSGAGSVDLKTKLKLGVSQMSLAAGYSEYVLDDVAVAPIRASYETVMHGVAYGVPVSGSVRKDSAPAASRIGVSLAPTLERLMAAQAARGMNVTAQAKKEYLETLVTAVANASIMSVGQRDGVVSLDEVEHADGFEAFQGPDTYEDVIVERKASDLCAGRPLRTKMAAQQSGKPPAANTIWTGNSRSTDLRADLDKTRQTAQDLALKKLRSATESGPVTRRVARPGPRYHRAGPPVIGLRNFGKPNRFHGDGRFDEQGRLLCRWTQEIDNRMGSVLTASSYLPRVRSAHIPAAAERLIDNTFLFDPYILPWSFKAIEMVVQSDLVGPTQNRLRGEIALRYTKDGRYDGDASLVQAKDDVAPAMRHAISEELRRFSIIEGIDPSPVGVTSWSQPWCPIWLEWEVAIDIGENLEGWSLGRIEFAGEGKAAGAQVTLSGRSPVTSGLAKTYQSVINSYLAAEEQRDEAGEGEIAKGHQDTLGRLAMFLGQADLGSVTLDRLDALWLALDTGPDGEVVAVPTAVAATLRDAGLPRLIASGKLVLKRARLIDTFGRFRDLDTRRVTLPAALETRTDAGEPALAMPPRLSLPARLMWRFVDPSAETGAAAEASLDQADPSRTVSPIAGYILPDFIDESVEFFDRDGNPLGEVLHDSVSGGLIWEGGVGREGPASNRPMENLPASARLCGRIAAGMIARDIAQRADPETEELESPLSAFLRAVDTTMWGVDTSLVSSGASIAGLVGRPVAVVSSVLWLDIPEDLAKTGAYGENASDIRDHLVREAVFDAVKSQAFEVRLGEFAKGHDGLYGYFVGPDFETFNLIDKNIPQAVRIAQAGFGFRSILGGIGGQIGPDHLPVPSPIDAPYISASDPLKIHSGQRVRLTLLMHPAARTHATTGFLPRKSIELLRDWVSPGLTRISPSARVGPVIVDPDKVRLPKIAAFGASQRWTRRDSPITWRNDPILSATQAAILPEGRATVEEGYIRIAPESGEEDIS